MKKTMLHKRKRRKNKARLRCGNGNYGKGGAGGRVKSYGVGGCGATPLSLTRLIICGREYIAAKFSIWKREEREGGGEV